MKNLLQNLVGCNLLVWEINPKKRNTNNIIQFVTKQNQDINVGDVIIGQYSPEHISVYEITEILEKRVSANPKLNHFTCKTSWSNKKPFFKDFNLITDSTFNKLFGLN